MQSIYKPDKNGEKRSRQPLPYLDAVYFLRPTRENLEVIMGDFGSSKVISIFFEPFQYVLCPLSERDREKRKKREGVIDIVHGHWPT